MSTRVNYLTTEQDFALEAACATLEAAGLTVYLVGSVLTRPDWRDVDLRCIDIDGDLRFITERRVLKRLLNAAMSAWLRERTGLPIDFQFQDMVEANRYDGKRNARGILIGCEAAQDSAQHRGPKQDSGTGAK